MKILLTNDDGIISQGIQMMSKLLADRGWLAAVVAPDRERSGMGHAITVGSPVRARSLDPGVYPSGVPAYACDGTPTDCVTIGAGILCPKADFVVSGINLGPNLSNDITYSGTVSAAMEGVILGLPSVAVSLCFNRGDAFVHNMTAAITAMAVLDYVKKDPLPPDTLLNINVPNVLLKDIKGFMVTCRGKRDYVDKFTTIKDPYGKDCYWIAGNTIDERAEGSDVTAVKDGFVSVTPINMDMTDYRMLERLRASDLEKNLAKAIKAR
jgi:5'-nucleotidase